MGVFFSAQEAATATGGHWIGAAIDGFEGVFTDSRIPEQGKIFLALRGDKFDGHAYLRQALNAGAVGVCVNEDSLNLVPCNVPALVVKDTLTAYQDLAAWHRMRFSSLAVAAVTGSVGKTGVKEMIKAVMAEETGNPASVLATIGNTNNHIGVPGNLLRLHDYHRFAVLELGTNHFGEIEPLSKIVHPNVAIVCAVAPCHLESFKDLLGVAREKSTIFNGLPDNGIAVIPFCCAGNDILRQAVNHRKTFTFGVEDGADFQANYLEGGMRGSIFSIRMPSGNVFRIEWKLVGRHQAVNAAGAAAVAYALGVSEEKIVIGLSHTELPGMRSKITEFSGCTFINDAYNANPASMLGALDYLSEFIADSSKLILLLGGMRELGAISEEEHLKLRKEARKRFPNAKIYLIGSEFTDVGKERFFQSANEAGLALADELTPGMIVFAKGSRGIGVEKALPFEAR